MKRSRGRGRRPQHPANRAFDSNGPDVRVRGTAAQIYEKYQTLARDAMVGGDRVMAENYQQHGEHYYRIMMSQAPQQSLQQDTQHDTQQGEDAFAPVAESETAAPANANANSNGIEQIGNGSENGADTHTDNGEAESPEDKPITKPLAKPRRRGPLRRARAAENKS